MEATHFFAGKSLHFLSGVSENRGAAEKSFRDTLDEKRKSGQKSAFKLIKRGSFK